MVRQEYGDLVAPPPISACTDGGSDGDADGRDTEGAGCGEEVCEEVEGGEAEGDDATSVDGGTGEAGEPASPPASPLRRGQLFDRPSPPSVETPPSQARRKRPARVRQVNFGH